MRLSVDNFSFSVIELRGEVKNDITIPVLLVNTQTGDYVGLSERADGSIYKGGEGKWGGEMRLYLTRTSI